MCTSQSVMVVLKVKVLVWLVETAVTCHVSKAVQAGSLVLHILPVLHKHASSSPPVLKVYSRSRIPNFGAVLVPQQHSQLKGQGPQEQGAVP